MLTKRTVWGSLAVLAMTAAGIVSIDVLDDWVGDWGTPLWIASGFFFPFVAGIAWGAGGLGVRGRLAGAVGGAAVVLAPSVGYALVEGPDLAELRLPLLWALFTPLAMAQGAIALPVGASARGGARRGEQPSP